MQEAALAMTGATIGISRTHTNLSFMRLPW
jgi:hypothetical protein